MEQTSNQKLKKFFKEYIIITFGLAIYAFSFTTFLIKANTVPGGAGGISSLIYFGLGEPSGFLSVGTLYFLVNLVLLVFGLLTIGPKFGVKTVYGILVTSLLMNVFAIIIPENFTGLSATDGDQLLMVIIGGVLCGLGVGICFMQGGSTGGTDIIAMIVNKYRNISFGKIIMACDVVIIACSLFVFKGDLKPAIYGIVCIASVGYTIDMVISGSRQSSQIMVFSPKYKEIGDRIIEEANRGVTYLHGEGGFSGAPQKIVSIVCRKAEHSNIYHIIKEVDPDAFITSAAVSSVYGQGFDPLKIKKNTKK